MTPPIIMWFRRDIRLQDNSALYHALQANQPIIPLFIFDPVLLKSDRVGAPRVAFMLNALQSLSDNLKQCGATLLIRNGKPLDVLTEVIKHSEATALYFNADYSPYAAQRDKAIETALDIKTFSFDDAVLMPYGSVLKADGKPYTVYTPYKNNWNTHTKPSVLETKFSSTNFTHANLESDALPTLQELSFETTIDLPPATEAFANDLLHDFIGHDIRHYSTGRNTLTVQPFVDHKANDTSFLSPYLRLGLISPRTCYWVAYRAYEQTNVQSERDSIATWVSELTWRDFYIQIMAAFPHVMERDFVETYRDLEWRNDADDLKAWQEGKTGYPIVDAAMRQMNTIGWMPNRARMVVASFMTKHLLIHWMYGDKYFMQGLIDGDPAANNGGWQWSAGTGTDAQPYFRIFNPVSQSEKFADPSYLRHWLPELNDVPDKFIHTPWLSPNPPSNYPKPIVEHDFARKRTLDAFKKARGEKEKT